MEDQINERLIPLEKKTNELISTADSAIKTIEAIFSRNTDNSQNMNQNINVAQVNRILDALENGGAGETQVVQQITNNYTSPPQAETEGDSGGNSGGFSDGGLDFARLRYLSGLF